MQESSSSNVPQFFPLPFKTPGFRHASGFNCTTFYQHTITNITTILTYTGGEVGELEVDETVHSLIPPQSLSNVVQEVSVVVCEKTG